MYAKFLKEASTILNEPTLNEVAEVFRDSARLWSEIATSALPDFWASLKKIRELTIEKNNLFEQQQPQALEKMQQINQQFEVLMKKTAQEIEQKNPAQLATELKQKILRCCEVEERALKKLNEAIK
jgi:uncharacterized protein YaaW (UPF0174 family)